MANFRSGDSLAYLSLFIIVRRAKAQGQLSDRGHRGLWLDLGSDQSLDLASPSLDLGKG